jgi:hypothetical protein
VASREQGNVLLLYSQWLQGEKLKALGEKLPRNFDRCRDNLAMRIRGWTGQGLVS